MFSCCFRAARKQLESYLNKYNYNLPIADIAPLLIAKGLGRNIFIFENRHNSTLITRIGFQDSTNEPIFLRKTGEHYDGIISSYKWTNKSKFKATFAKSAILKMPFINNAHCKDIRQIIHQHDLPILVVFTPGLKLINHLTTSALEKEFVI